MENTWNNRYNTDEFIYGKEPNEFFKTFINSTKPGKLLLPGEGEGRNAVYAAAKGFEVFAFDYSSVAKDKAILFAESLNVNINYDILDINKYEQKEKVDYIAFIYTHFPKTIRKEFFQKITNQLEKDGKIIMEVFAKGQIENNSGGPKNLELLYSIEEIKQEFNGINFEYLEELEIEIQEGSLHQGKAKVIRMHASKI